MLALFLVLLHVGPGISLEGFVRSNDTGLAVVGAEVDVMRVDAPGDARQAYSDSLGRYVVSDLVTGTYHVHVSRGGYDARDVDISLAGGPRMALDIALPAHPVLLSAVRVTGVLAGAFAAPAAALNWLDSGDVGTRTVRGDALHANSMLPEPDALLALTSGGDVMARAEGPTALHVSGGSAGENVMLLDGVPLFNPYHTLGTLTAIDPDIVSAVTLHTGAPTAEFDGATAGIIEISTADGDSARVVSHGGLTMTAVREAVGGPLPAGLGTFLVSARADRSPIVSDRRSTSYAARFRDVFVKSVTAMAGGSLELFALHGADRLGFPAGDDPEEASVLAPGTLSTGRNALDWSTGTDAVRWRTNGGPATWDLRAWHTHFDATLDWAQQSALASSLDDMGAAATGSWAFGFAHLSAGLTIDRYDVRYHVTPIASSSSTGTAIPDASGALLTLDGAPLLGSGFVETRWQAGTRWSGALGVRGQVAGGSFRAPEPRFSLRFTPTPRVSLAVGVARVHQDVQSLRNEESPLDVVTGISLPAIAGIVDSSGAYRVPLARADEATAAMNVRLASGTTLGVAAFTRAESGVAMVAPVTMQPFAVQGFAAGNVRASGLTASLSRDGHLLSVNAGYSYLLVRQRAGASSYTPSYGTTHSATLGIGVHVLPTTALRLAATANSGGATNLLVGHVEWSPFTASEDGANLEGSPQQIIGPMDGARLPPYARLDVGIRHTIVMRMFGRVTAITGDANLTNLFDRANAFALTIDPRNGALRPLHFQPRSAVLGIEWTF